MKNGKPVGVSFVVFFGFVLFVLWCSKSYEDRQLTKQQLTKAHIEMQRHVNWCRKQGKGVSVVYIDTETAETKRRCEDEQLHTVANGCKHGK